MKKIKGIFIIIMFSLILIGTRTTTLASTSPIQCKDENTFYETIIKTIIERKPTVTIKYTGNIDEIYNNSISFGVNVDNIFNKVWTIDNPSTSDDADYARFHISSYGIQLKSNGTEHIFQINLKYLSTAEQEKQVNKEVKKVLEQLNLEGKSDYEKVKGVHNFVIETITYDDSLSSHSAYDGLILKKAVCQGYSTLMYKLLTDLGIECKIITGTGISSTGSGPHGWNIVKVDGKWYNIDATWDDMVTSISYDYFLKSERDFSNHLSDNEFKTTSFKENYPISSKAYKLNENDIKNKETTQKPSIAFIKDTITLVKGKTKQLGNLITVKGTSNKMITCKSDNLNIVKIDKTGKLIALKKGTTTITASLPTGEKETCKIVVK